MHNRLRTDAGVLDHLDHLGESVAAMDNDRFSQFESETDMAAEDPDLIDPRRKIAIEVEPGLADGRRGRSQLGELCPLLWP